LVSDDGCSRKFQLGRADQDLAAGSQVQVGWSFRRRVAGSRSVSSPIGVFNLPMYNTTKIACRIWGRLAVAATRAGSKLALDVECRFEKIECVS
jgi:hypothetical protein